MKKFIICLFTVFSFVSVSHVFAASIFELTVTSQGQTYKRDFGSAEELINGLDEDEIRLSIQNYTNVSYAAATLNFRGLPITLTYTANSTKLTLDIPSIGVYETFTGTTRDNSVDLLEDWFQKEGGSALTRLMQELAASTANDPIAGNPKSLMASMASTNYNRGFTSRTSEIQPREIEAGESNANLAGLGFEFGYYEQGDLNGQSYQLPLSYTVRSNTDPRRQLTFNLPITVTEIDGARSYSLGIGAGLTWPMNKQWALTPAIDYGLVGSVDLGSVGQILSGSLTSAYVMDIGKYKLNIGNMAGYYKTLKFSYADYSFDPDIQNTILRNGVMLAIPTDKMKKNTILELFVVDTRFFGSDLFIDQYNEFGFSFGFRKVERKTFKEKIRNYLRDLRVGATYLYSNESKGFSVNFGYTF